MRRWRQQLARDRLEARRARAEEAIDAGADREGARERSPAAAGGLGDLDVVEAVAEAVARGGAGVRPALGGRDPAPGAVAAGQVDRMADRLAVDPDAPGVGLAGDLEDGDPPTRARRKAVLQLVVLRRRARLCDLVVEVGVRAAGKAAEAHLDPLVLAVRPLAWAADADPAGNMAVREDARGPDRRQRRSGTG